LNGNHCSPCHGVDIGRSSQCRGDGHRERVHSAIGPATVTAGTGLDLAAGATVTLKLKAGELVYAIRSAGADATISVLRIGV
jgi:hypothetical protein